MTEPLSISVVILAFNEADNLGPVVEQTIESLADCAESVSAYQLVIVNDGSTDGTADVLAQLAQTHPCVTAKTHETNRGMGAGIKTGYGAATGEWLTMIPADGQVPIAEILKLVPLAQNGAEMVLGNYTQRRQVDGGGRMLLSKGLRALMALMLGTNREISGIVLFRRALWATLPVKSDSFFANLELPVRAIRGGHDVRESSIEVHARRSGHSKVANLRRIVWVASELTKFRLNLLSEALGR